jgi:uncharacterized integral membrane protein
MPETAPEDSLCCRPEVMMSDPGEETERAWRLKLIVSVVAIVLLVIFWAQNRDRVKVTFWIADATVRLWVALAVAGLVGFIAGFFARGRRD